MNPKIKLFESFEALNSCVIKCRLCPRLVDYREHVLPKPKFQHEIYWRKPIPGFGDPKAWLLLTGLAPSPDGGNRTGRIFTGDATGRFLMKMLYQAGFANQPICESAKDGLILKDCYLTAAVKCVPPLHKPTPQECRNCAQYYHNEVYLLKNLKAVLALGRLAFDAYLQYAKMQGFSTRNMPFRHGAKYQWGDRVPALYASYHPSPQNTNTGKLSEEMLLTLLEQIRAQSSLPAN